MITILFSNNWKIYFEPGAFADSLLNFFTRYKDAPSFNPYISRDFCSSRHWPQYTTSGQINIKQ